MGSEVVGNCFKWSIVKSVITFIFYSFTGILPLLLFIYNL